MAVSLRQLDRANPETEIARAAKAYSDWGRWGADDVLGTVNYLTEETGLATVTSDGDLVTGIEHMAPRVCGRGVLLDVGRIMGDELGELPDGFAITEDHLTATAAAHGVAVDRGDLVLVRTGRYARALREGWGDYAGGASPGLSFTTVRWLHGSEIAALATDTWGFEVRPNEFDHSFQPLHQVAIPHIGLLIGEMRALEELGADWAADGVYEFFLTAAPLPITGAVGSPINPIAVK